MAEAIGSIKQRIKEDLGQRFENFKNHISTLENVIDTNSKLIKDMTEAIQEKNIHN